MCLGDGGLHARARGGAGFDAQGQHRILQRRQGQLGVTQQAQRFVVAADLHRVGIQVDEAGVARVELPAVGAVLVGAAADQQDDVGLLHHVAQVFGPRPRPHDVADHAERERVRLVHTALAHDGGANRQVRRLLQRRQLARGVREVNAAAGDDQRAFCLCQQLGGFGDARRVRQGAVQRHLAQLRHARAGGQRLVQQQVRRHQQHRRARPAGAGRGEGHVHVVFQPVGAVHALHPLRHRGEQAEVVQLLEGVAVGGVARHLLHQGQHGHAGLQRLRQRGHQQGGGGAVLGGDDADLAADAGIAIRHRAAGVLLPIDLLVDADMRAGQVEGAGQALAEGQGYAVAGEGLGQAQRHGGVASGPGGGGVGHSVVSSAPAGPSARPVGQAGRQPASAMGVKPAPDASLAGRVRAGRGPPKGPGAAPKAGCVKKHSLRNGIGANGGGPRLSRRVRRPKIGTIPVNVSFFVLNCLKKCCLSLRVHT